MTGSRLCCSRSLAALWISSSAWFGQEVRTSVNGTERARGRERGSEVRYASHSQRPTGERFDFGQPPVDDPASRTSKKVRQTLFRVKPRRPRARGILSPFEDSLAHPAHTHRTHSTRRSRSRAGDASTSRGPTPRPTEAPGAPGRRIPAFRPSSGCSTPPTEISAA